MIFVMIDKFIFKSTLNNNIKYVTNSKSNI